jgi:hypothetical protein
MFNSAKRAFVVLASLLAATAVGVLGSGGGGGGAVCPSTTFVNTVCSKGATTIQTWASGLLKPANATNMPGIVGHLVCSDSKSYTYRSGNSTVVVEPVLVAFYQAQGCVQQIGRVNKDIVFCCTVGRKTSQVYFTVAAFDQGLIPTGCTPRVN